MNFMGSDTVIALVAAQQFYGAKKVSKKRTDRRWSFLFREKVTEKTRKRAEGTETSCEKFLKKDGLMFHISSWSRLWATPSQPQSIQPLPLGVMP